MHSPEAGSVPAWTHEAVEVVPANPRWSELAATEIARLEGVLGPCLMAGIHHVGSTSVPGLEVNFREMHEVKKRYPKNVVIAIADGRDEGELEGNHQARRGRGQRRRAGALGEPLAAQPAHALPPPWRGVDAGP